MHQIHLIQIFFKKLWWQQIQNLGFMEFNFVVNTHLNKNALMIKI